MVAAVGMNLVRLLHHRVELSLGHAHSRGDHLQ
jgi:hypothetical protein